MAIEIKPELLKDIAAYLDTGMLCFYNKTNGELETYPEGLEYSGLENEWAKVIAKIEASPNDYLQIEKMNSLKAFQIMENFINGIRHTPAHNKFVDAISRKKPFARFNDMLSYYPDLREQWFAYKLQSCIEFVKSKIELREIEKEPFNGDFCVYLEYHLCRTFQNSPDKRFRWFGCDGVDMPSLNSLSVENITKTKKIETLAWMEINGQKRYVMIIKLGPGSMKNYIESLSLIDCLPSEESLDWVTLEIEKKTIELQLN
jgi:Uncharacterised protein family (UPF0158)